ncbi:hypothetical protein [Sphingomonas aracearum]|uniref:Uncharacterized protein n=1 Tax=Sphingomonas aracearum TaxID=2283317 RepID=A0A369VV71_9SPHN|nr:hypothetical protein [Sphingomonas aracearum]RDE06284.1 hypothetical protein DVW87_00690 [Sphingomonas aracearum]
MIMLRAAARFRRQVGRACPVMLLLASALSVSGPAAAGDYASRAVAGWTVAESADGNGCFLTREYDRAGRTTLLLGLEVDGTNHLTVLNANWSIAPKDRLQLAFRLSKGQFPKHFAVGIVADGKQGFVTSFGQQFPAYFAASPSLHILRGDVTVERLDLGGSGAAVAELRRCVDAQRAQTAPRAANKAGDIPRDPFAAQPERKRKR